MVKNELVNLVKQIEYCSIILQLKLTLQWLKVLVFGYHIKGVLECVSLPFLILLLQNAIPSGLGDALTPLCDIFNTSIYDIACVYNAKDCKQVWELFLVVVSC